MITKGTKEYETAAKTANELTRMANANKKENGSCFDTYFERVARALQVVKELNVFASKVAETIDKGMNPYNYNVARMSSKQAWIIACAMVENQIELP